MDKKYELAKGMLDEYLRQHQRKKTPERDAILQAACAINGFFTLQQLREQMEATCPFAVSRATIYNTIRLLTELGLLACHKLHGTANYVVVVGGEGKCYQLCTLCGSVREFSSPPVVNAVMQSKIKRFRQEGFSLYVYGLCSSCQARQSRRKGRTP